MPAGAFWAKIPIFEHLVLIADSESTENLVKIRTCSSSGLAFCVELWPKQVWYRSSVPMSYIWVSTLVRINQDETINQDHGDLFWDFHPPKYRQIPSKFTRLINFWVSPRSPKYNFWEPLQAKRDWKEKIRDLSTSLNNFGSLKNIQRGAAAFGSRSPFVCFLAPKILRTAA